MTAIVTEFWKFKYNCHPMVMCALGYNFQSKVENLLGDIKGIETYINDIIVLSKDSFSNHMEKLRIIFGLLRAAGLKDNSPKCSFGLKKIYYLGYVITREVIKPDLKKVQGIMDMGRPTTTNELRALIGMGQYYMDMCPRQYHILASQTEASSGPKVRKLCLNDDLESSLHESKCMVSSEALLSYPY